MKANFLLIINFLFLINNLSNVITESSIISIKLQNINKYKFSRKRYNSNSVEEQ